MIAKAVKTYLLILLLLAAWAAQGQSCSISWYKVAGGGGVSAGTNGGTVYSLSGTIGQQDASSPMTGGAYSLTGGFWSLISVLQSPGAPALAITRSSGSIVISWPDRGTYILQQNSNLSAPSGWAASGYTVSTNNGNCSATFTPPPGNLFFRLAQ
ncbi:MAG: hypothetical protein ACLQU4_16900 [Limisphaerales bacterium]